MKKSLCLFLLILAFPIILSAQVLPVKYEHSDQIDVIARDASSSVIATGGKDGSLLIRDGVDFSLLKRIQVGYLPIKQIAINAKRKAVAIFQTDSINANIIRVINYEAGEELYSLRLDQKPLFISFSDSGKYFFYSNPQVNGLNFIEQASGFKKPFLASIDTIVPAALISPDDSRLVTYSAAGAINFYDIKSGKLTKRISCIANLQNATFIQSGSYMLANSRDKLMAIQTSTGKVFNEIAASGIIKIVPNNKLGQAVIYSSDDGYAFVQKWNYGQANTKLTPIDYNQDFSLYSALLYHNDEVLCGTTTGELLKYDVKNKKTTLSSLVLNRFSGIACDDQNLILSDEKSIFTIPLNDIEATKTLSSIMHSSVVSKRPFSGEFEILNISSSGEGGSYLLYECSEPKNMRKTDNFVASIYLYQPAKSGEKFSKVFTISSPIINLKKTDNGYLGLTKNGKSFLLDKNFRQIFSYDSYGTKDVTILSSSKLATGRAKESNLKSTIIQVDTTTGETFPIKTDELITFDLNYNKNLVSLFTIGIEQRGETTATVLKNYHGNNFSRVDTMLAVNGEDHKATLLYDPYTSKLYTTLGAAGIRVIQWGGFTTSQKTGHIPSKLAVNRNLLFALNQDGSVTAWDKKSAKEYWTLFQFANGSWLTLSEDQPLLDNIDWNDYKAN